MQCCCSLQTKIGSGLEDIKCSTAFNGNNLHCNCIILILSVLLQLIFYNYYSNIIFCFMYLVTI